MKKGDTREKRKTEGMFEERTTGKEDERRTRRRVEGRRREMERETKTKKGERGNEKKETIAENEWCGGSRNTASPHYTLCIPTAREED